MFKKYEETWTEAQLWEFHFATPAQAKRVAAKMKRLSHPESFLVWQRGRFVHSAFLPVWSSVGEAPFHTFPPTEEGGGFSDDFDCN